MKSELKIWVVAFLMHSSIESFCQETKKVSRRKGDEGEVYSVLKSDKTIRHGPYEKYFNYSNPIGSGKLLIEKGQYEMNLRTGTWMTCWGEKNILSKGNYDKDLKAGNWEYYKNGIVLEKGEYNNDLREGLWVYFEKAKGVLEKGSYKEGKKVGKWQYFYQDIPVQTYDYSLDSVLQSLNDPSESEIIIGPGNEIIKAKVERSPQYVGHKRQFQTDMSGLTKYPAAARRLGLEGNVAISFFVNEDGSTSNFEIIKDIGGDCARSVMEAFKQNTTRWKPGLFKGQKVKVKYYQVISFKLTMDPDIPIGTTEITYQ